MFERWNNRGSRETGKFFSQPVHRGAKTLQLIAFFIFTPPFLLSFLSLPSSLFAPSLSSSLPSRTDRGGRSQSAHILQLASITWTPQIQS